jgi:tetratricopeptide (TPR) repeat protein
MGHYGQAWNHAAEGVSILRNQGPRPLFADALIRLAHPLIALGDIPTAQRHLEERLALVRAIGDERRIASTLNTMADLHRLNNKLELAVPIYEEALALARGKCDPPTLAICQLNVALVSVVRGDLVRAHTLLREALSLVEEPAFKHVVGIALDVAFALAAARGEWTVGARLLGASEAQQAEMRHQREAADAASVVPYAASTREALGEASFSAAYAAGRALSYDDALAETLAWLDSRDV